MEEVDNLLLQNLRSLGCEVEESENLKDLSSERALEGIVRCLWAVSPETRDLLPSASLPPNMTARFKQGTKIAEAIKKLGFSNDIGYQTLLYGNLADLRRVLVFLVERIPRGDATAAQGGAMDPEEELRVRVAEKLRLSAQVPWLPWYCRRLRFHWDGRLWQPPNDQDETVPFVSQRGKLSEVSWRNLPASAIRALDISDHDSSHDQAGFNLRDELNSTVSKAKPRLPRKPVLPPKPNLPRPDPEHQTESSQQTAEKAEEEAAFAAAVREAENIKALAEETESLELSITHKLQQYKQMEAELDRLEEGQKGREKERVRSRRWRAALDNPDVTLEKLEGFVSQSEQRMKNLEQSWSSTSQPILDAIALHRSQSGLSEATDQLQEEMRVLEERIPQLESELEAKNVFLHQLEKEVSKKQNGVNRSAYTRRILEIVASVRKQREEIGRTLSQTRVIQKDINSLTGKLERTFTAADELMFSGAKTDEGMKRAYKLLVNLHQSCAALVQATEDKGHLLREQEDIQDQLEIEQQKNTDDNLERLVNDYCQVKQENETMEVRLAELRQ